MRMTLLQNLQARLKVLSFLAQFLFEANMCQHYSNISPLCLCLSPLGVRCIIYYTSAPMLSPIGSNSTGQDFGLEPRGELPVTGFPPNPFIAMPLTCNDALSCGSFGRTSVKEHLKIPARTTCLSLFITELGSPAPIPTGSCRQSTSSGLWPFGRLKTTLEGSSRPCWSDWYSKGEAT